MMKKLVTLTMLMAVVGLMAGPASAALYETGFENSGDPSGYNFTTGTINGQDGWTSTSGTAEISTTGAITLNQSLRSHSTGDARISFAAQTIVTLEVKVMETAVTTGLQHMLYLRDSDSYIGACVRLEGGNVRAYSGASHYDTGADYAANVAIDVKIIADTTNDTYDLYIGTSLVAEDYAFRTTTGVGELSEFRNTVYGSDAGLIDDLVITPEPATMTLLLLGLPLALRRRRK